MTDDQRLEWGREELAARKADLSLRTAEGLRDAKQRADARRRAIGASKSAAASMVAEATRELRWAAYRTTASQPAAAEFDPQPTVLTDDECEYIIGFMGVREWEGLTRDDVRLWAKALDELPYLRAADNAAAQPDAALGDWRPISEAPADGIWALVYADGAINCAYVQAGKLPEDWTEPACPNVIPEDVTHWMPLPRHPATADNSPAGPA